MADRAVAMMMAAQVLGDGEPGAAPNHAGAPVAVRRPGRIGAAARADLIAARLLGAKQRLVGPLEDRLLGVALAGGGHEVGRHAQTAHVEDGEEAVVRRVGEPSRRPRTRLARL